jgi:hypothetical protein
MPRDRLGSAAYFTKRLAETWLRELLDEARCGTLPGLVRTGATFEDAAAEYLRYIEHDRVASRRPCAAIARRHRTSVAGVRHVAGGGGRR